MWLGEVQASVARRSREGTHKTNLEEPLALGKQRYPAGVAYGNIARRIRGEDAPWRLSSGCCCAAGVTALALPV